MRGILTVRVVIAERFTALTLFHVIMGALAVHAGAAAVNTGRFARLREPFI
jgi:hypothetical protein